MRISALTCYPVKSLGRVDFQAARLTPLGLEGDRRWAVVGPDHDVLTQRVFAAMAAIRTHSDPEGNLYLEKSERSITVAPPQGEHGRTPAIVWGAWVDAALAAPEACAWLSDCLDTDARLVRLDREEARVCGYSPAGDKEYTSFADGLPLLITTTGSLAALESLLVGEGLAGVPMDRFRANVVIEHDEPWAEHRWSVLRVGNAEIRIVRDCERCQVPTIDQDTGAADPRSPQARGLLRTLVGASGTMGRAVFGVNAIPMAAGCPAWLRVGDRVTVVE